MIFETLNDSAEHGELLMVEHGMCHWHLCTAKAKAGQITIREIIVEPKYRGKGIGSRMIRRLEFTPGATSLFAKCPAGLPANKWYQAQGFHVVRSEWTKSGRMIICWEKNISEFTRISNVENLEVIYCAGGNARSAEIAIDAGMLYGAQLPGSVSYRPYFADQNHNKLTSFESTREQRDRECVRYITGLIEHAPYMATVIDWTTGIKWAEIEHWLDGVSQYAHVLIVIPKIVGSVQDIPTQWRGKPIRLGYSVPTKYGGTDVPLSEFASWVNGVHLLGGSPEVQAEVYRQLPNVRSVDSNKHNWAANHMCAFWVHRPHVSAANPHWPTMAEAGEPQPNDAKYEAFRRSCVNIMQMWREVVSQPALPMDRYRLKMGI